MIAFYSAIFGFLGVAVGWFATHRFTVERDRRSRRGAFLGYLLQWRSSIARVSRSDRLRVWEAYERGVGVYHLELGKITEDYLRDAQFLQVSDLLGNLQHEAVLKAPEDAREPICTPIDKLRKIVRGM
jgi:hypothetical protein